MAERLLNRLRRAVEKVKLLLSLDVTRWMLSSFVRSSSGGPRRLSFKTPRPSLLDSTEEHGGDELGSPFGRISRTASRSPSGASRTLSSASDRMSRTTSDASSGSGDDIDRRADIFIENFYRQLRMERQVSLELRYSTDRRSLERTHSDN